MGRNFTLPQLNPHKIVQERARAYIYKGKYPQVIVFTKWQLEIDRLKRTFGGNSYTHGTGFVWMVTKRSLVIELIEKMKPFLPSENGFEDIVAPHLTT